MTTATTDLIHRDPAVPGLGVLTDERQFEGWISDHGPQQGGPFVRRYLRYKPGTSVVAGVSGAGGPVIAYAVSAAAAPKLDKMITKAPPGAVLGYDPERRIVLAAATADRDLPGLAALLTAGADTLTYKPQRRWVGTPYRLGADEQPSILRCYRPGDVGRAIRGWPHLVDVRGFRTPAIDVRDRAGGCVRVQSLPGRPADLTDGSNRLPALETVGRALAEWHRQSPPVRHSVGRTDPVALADQLIMLLPDQARRISRFVDELIGRPPAAADQGWCHGDFSADQVLITDPHDQEPAIIDWDRSGHGPRAADLATIDAGLEDGPSASSGRGMGVGPSTSSEDVDTEGWQGVLAGYTAVRELPPDLRRHRALARLARAAEPFRTARRDWHSAVTARLDRVEELL